MHEEKSGNARERGVPEFHSQKEPLRRQYTFNSWRCFILNSPDFLLHTYTYIHSLNMSTRYAAEEMFSTDPKVAQIERLSRFRMDPESAAMLLIHFSRNNPLYPHRTIFMSTSSRSAGFGSTPPNTSDPSQARSA